MLNPCSDRPDRHLVHHFAAAPDDTNGNTPAPVSFMLPAALPNGEENTFRGEDDLSLKGAVSIHVYGLNRLDLVQAQTELLRRLEFLKSVIIQLHALADQIADEIADMARHEAPYVSMVQAWRKALISELAV